MVVCKITWAFWIGPNISPILLTVMAYERYKAIVDPFSRVHGISATRLHCMVFGSWVIGLGFTIFDVYIVKFDSKNFDCVYSPVSWYSTTAHYVTLLTVIYSSCSFAVFYFYFRVICSLKRQNRNLGAQGQAQRLRELRRSKVMNFVLAAVVAFVIFVVVPNYLFLVKNLARQHFDFRTEVLFEIILATLIILNSALNPVIYLVFIKSFRDRLRMMLRRKRSRLNEGIEQSNMQDNRLHCLSIENDA